MEIIKVISVVVLFVCPLNYPGYRTIYHDSVRVVLFPGGCARVEPPAPDKAQHAIKRSWLCVVGVAMRKSEVCGVTGENKRKMELIFPLLLYLFTFKTYAQHNTTTNLN